MGTIKQHPFYQENHFTDINFKSGSFTLEEIKQSNRIKL